MQSRGLTPINNSGDGNCVFISLAQIVFGDPAKFEFIRYMIVHRLKSFPKKYHKSPDYCNTMAINGNPASQLELQLIADICFAVVECYSLDNFLVPAYTKMPLRLSTVSRCKNRIRLWIQPGHCMALVDLFNFSPLISNDYMIVKR